MKINAKFDKRLSKDWILVGDKQKNSRKRPAFSQQSSIETSSTDSLLPLSPDDLPRLFHSPEPDASREDLKQTKQRDVMPSREGRAVASYLATKERTLTNRISRAERRQKERAARSKCKAHRKDFNADKERRLPIKVFGKGMRDCCPRYNH